MAYRRRKEFLVFGAPAIQEEEIAEVVATLRSGWLGTGPKVGRFEALFRAYIGAQHALALSSCTAGLHVVMFAAGIKPGDEVITSPLTFAATANAILHAGATPIFADVEPGTLNLDPEQVNKQITPRTRAIIPVHLYGRPCNMDALLDIAQRHQLLFIEDAAHAIEAIYRGRRMGTFGLAGCFSFYVTKNVITAEGGMVTTNNDEIADKIKILSLHGLSRDAWKRYSDSGYRHYEVIYPGFKYNMTDIQASLGIHQLNRVEVNLKRREAIWARYDAAFSDLPVDVPPLAENNTRHARHLYTLLLRFDKIKMSRDEFLVRLQEENIGAGVHFISLHLQKYYRETFGYQPEDFPVATEASRRTVSLPLSPKLTDQDVDDVISAVRHVLRS
ncbi:MAG: DegT/DnrJ/EryC1/StrS family aminotransferase [bacterium]